MSARRRVLALAGLAGVALAAGCASPSGLRTHAVPAEPARLEAERSLAGVARAADAHPDDAWWRAYGDPQLDALVGEAMAASPTLRAAQARVERARALAQAVGAPPDLVASVNASSTREQLSRHGLVPPGLGGSWIWQNQATLNFSYEFDFWGRHAAAYEAALGEARAAEADARAARLVLAAALAHVYVQFGRDFDQRDLAQALVAERERRLALVRERVAAGLDSQFELKEAEAGLPEARRQVLLLDEATTLARHQIAALLGRGPDRGLALARPRLGAAPAPLMPALLPAELIGRRPDIAASRDRVEAAAHGVAAARARFYPNIDLVAFAGLQSLDWSHFAQSGSRTLGVGPALSLPLFDSGALRGNLGARNAEYDAAVEQYNQAVADALRDVADQVATLRSLARQDAELDESVAAAREGYRLALARYRAGLSNYLAVLEVESQLIAQRRLVVELRARRLDASIDLARALGGGYTAKD